MHLEPEFTLLREMLLARQKAGLSQAQIAERMGTNLLQLQDLNHPSVVENIHHHLIQSRNMRRL